MIEQLLIENIVTAWIRYQVIEYRFSSIINGEHTLNEGEYWGKLLNHAQRRYLRAVETLARVRKITRATFQVNIAEAGSQQLNIVGDINRPMTLS